MRFIASAKWTGTFALCTICLALVAASAVIPKLWQRVESDYAEAVGNMRRQSPTDRQVVHAWPNGICPAGYVLEPNMFELERRRWDGCYKPGAWTPQLNATTGLMELRGSIDFLLHLEVMHTPVALLPIPKGRKAMTTRQE